MLPPDLPLPPAHTLTEALKYFARTGASASPRHALDLGCGRGIDTLELLRQGWRVTAIDQQPAAGAAVRRAAEAAGLAAPTTIVADFEELTFPPCELVNATFALPFCRPAHFASVWRRLTAALTTGGRFAGQFFGPHDSWAADPALTICSRAEVEALLTPDYELELLVEQEKDGRANDGQFKHWHVLHVVAQRL